MAAGSTFQNRRDAAVEHAAATHLQAIVRGKQARADLEKKHAAATRVQSIARGKSTRRKVANKDIGSVVADTADEGEDESGHTTTASFLVIDEDELPMLKIGHISEMPKVLLAIMSRHRTRIQELFRTLDADRNGAIKLDEFTTVLEGIGFEVPRDDDLERLFKAIDTDADQSVTFEEIEAFCRAVRRGHQLLEPEPEDERRRRLGLDDEAARARAAQAAEAERLRRKQEEEARAAARLAAAEAARKEKERREKEMASWLARSQAENERRYQDMLAAALAMLPGGANNRLGNGTDDDEASAKRRQPPPPWTYYPMPRVERTGFKPMAYRAAPNPLPASVAFPHPTREVSSNQWRSFHAASASAATLGKRSPLDPASTTTLTRPASAATLARPVSAAALARPASAAALARPASAAALSKPSRSAPIGWRIAPSRPPDSPQLVRTASATAGIPVALHRYRRVTNSRPSLHTWKLNTYAHAGR